MINKFNLALYKYIIFWKGQNAEIKIKLIILKLRVIGKFILYTNIIA